MNFSLPEDTLLIQRQVREFAEQEIKPHIMQWDEAQKFPAELWRSLGELGLLGAMVPEKYDGAALDTITYAAIIEELGRIDPSITLSVAAHNSLPVGHILLSANEEQKQRYLPKLACGDWIGAWALTEPGAGSDAGSTKTTAVKDGDSYVISGSKNFITNADVAGLFVVLAVTDRAKGNNGISAFLVEADTPGLTVDRKENKLGMRASNTSSLSFVDCRIPKDNLMGAWNQGFRDALRVLDGGRISIGAMAVGLAQGAFEACRAYALERQQFNRPIASFQGMQWKFADMATEIEAARLLVMQAAWLRDQRMPYTKQASMAKLFASEVSVKVANEAVQVFGGYGFTKDFPAEKFYRDCKLCTIGEGTSEIQRMVIARQVL